MSKQYDFEQYLDSEHIESAKQHLGDDYYRVGDHLATFIDESDDRLDTEAITDYIDNMVEMRDEGVTEKDVRDGFSMLMYLRDIHVEDGDLVK